MRKRKSEPVYTLFLSLRELRCVDRMIGVAEAAEHGEGDYASWEDEDYNALVTLGAKLIQAHVRSPKV